MKDLIAGYWGSNALYSPRSTELLSALTTLNPFPDNRSGKAASDLFVSRLFEDYGYFVRNTTTPVRQQDGSMKSEFPVRISTHLFHNRKDVEDLFAAMIDFSRRFDAGTVIGEPAFFGGESEG